MLKLIIWGIVGYIIYRYFQLKSQVKEASRQEFLNRQQPPTPQHEKREVQAEDIDYEEIK